jgi:aspartyl-tRNA(Asn)/glutamyl-tRNA(Gln) amidotransferase subunit A
LVRTAGATANAVRSGEITATEAVSWSLARIEHDPLNAFTELDADGALDRAGLIDEMLATGADPGPLAGVPVAIKDLIDQRGHVTTAGSSFYRHLAGRSATCVERLEAAGAVVVGRTGLHEFAFGFSSENAHFGPVLNPWDRTTSPGGSSGGSAVAVSAGWVPLAIGTDTGGSVRVPAALCGTVGLKVTHGAIPLTGVFPLAPSLDTVGPVALDLDDLRMAFETMRGLDPGDPWSRSGPGPEPQVRRVGVPTQWMAAAPLADQVADAFDALLSALPGRGIDVVPLDEPRLVPTGMIDAMAYGEVAPIHREWWREHPDAYGDEVADRMEAVYAVSLDDHVAARTWRAGLEATIAEVFANVDALLTPATCVTRKPLGASTVPTRGGQTGYRSALAWFTALVNHTSCPAVVAPLATGGTPPPALQIVTPWWGEERALVFAQRLTEWDLLTVPEPAPSWRNR